METPKLGPEAGHLIVALAQLGQAAGEVTKIALAMLKPDPGQAPLSESQIGELFKAIGSLHSANHRAIDIVAAVAAGQLDKLPKVNVEIVQLPTAPGGLN